ncbi:MAG: hypothetical protein PVH61_32100 [Candidatus Aminicenantes bacterium]
MSELREFEGEKNHKLQNTNYKDRGTLEVTHAIMHPCNITLPNPQYPIHQKIELLDSIESHRNRCYN